MKLTLLLTGLTITAIAIVGVVAVLARPAERYDK
jgi:hypothetical protein